MAQKVNWIKDYCDEGSNSFSDHKTNGFMNRDELLKKLNKSGSRNLRGLIEINLNLKNIPAPTCNDDDDGAHATRIHLRKSPFSESLFLGSNTNTNLFTNSEEDFIKWKSLMALVEEKVFISYYVVAGKGDTL